jgi:hypothetical protein
LWGLQLQRSTDFGVGAQPSEMKIKSLAQHRRQQKAELIEIMDIPMQ